MRALLVAVVFVSALLGDPPNVVSRFQNGPSIVAAVAGADRMMFETTFPEPRTARQETSQKAIIDAVQGYLTFADKPTRGEKTIIDGKEVYIVPFCQCDGDYRIHFYRKDAEIVCIGLFHDESIRVITADADHYEPEFDLLPGYGQKLRLFLNDLIRKEANQALLPTSTADTPPAAQESRQP